jgi:hypothetical protein
VLSLSWPCLSFHRILTALIREQPTEDLANLSSRPSPNISAVPRLQQCNRLKGKPSVVRMLYRRTVIARGSTSKRLLEEIMHPPIAKALFPILGCMLLEIHSSLLLVVGSNLEV